MIFESEDWALARFNTCSLGIPFIQSIKIEKKLGGTLIF